MKLTDIPNITEPDLAQMKEFLNHLPHSDEYPSEEISAAIERYLTDYEGNQRQGLTKETYDRWKQYLPFMTTMMLIELVERETKEKDTQ